MMNQQDIFNKVGNILRELNEQYQFLAQNPTQLNDLELELFLANADFLADHVRIVQKLNAVVEHAAPNSAHALLKEQNTIVLPQSPVQSIPEKEPVEPEELEEIATAEEQEGRVDVKPAQELFDDEAIEEEVAEQVLEKDFFKPDQEDHSFEFILGKHSEEEQFDYEAKSVEEIFDRPLSKAEEEILAQKKRIHLQDEISSNVPGAVSNVEDDEIGPEPFLISHEEDIQPEAEISEVEVPEVELPKVELPKAEVKTEPVLPVEVNDAVKNEPIAALRDVEMDDPIISPPVIEKPIFTPEAIPVRPASQPISSTPAPSLNDLLGKTNAKENEAVKSPIADLKQGISINEKLLFIRELFKGYNLAYSEAIDIVNKMNSFEAADSFLQSNYAAKNDWASKQTTVDQFYELLNRRFSH
ncbi:hypothetical protein [Pedobacter sp. BMA]|uniref:hypothetical protein n=1 Tax=Pedobacter sp. BMA TaxID=1663685 RepID=UPI0006493A7C|nr:hypothetical protein [Pedobacter sp. BMA]KLT66496.1 hypothetical protein AB669_04730 [Pedobacter sp. BMA]